MSRGMSGDYSHWQARRRRPAGPAASVDADGEPLRDLQAELIEMHSQAPPQGPPPLSRMAVRSPAWRCSRPPAPCRWRRRRRAARGRPGAPAQVRRLVVAKGKLDPGEEWPVAAVREAAEETGYDVRLGRPLPAAAYTVLARRGSRPPRRSATGRPRSPAARRNARQRDRRGGAGWTSSRAVGPARLRPRPRPAARVVAGRQRRASSTTWPLAVVRHAQAVPRGSWADADDRARPLDARRPAAGAARSCRCSRPTGVRAAGQLPLGALHRHARAPMPRGRAAAAPEEALSARRATPRTPTRTAAPAAAARPGAAGAAVQPRPGARLRLLGRSLRGVAPGDGAAEVPRDG